jgi:large subunit ribosomal protein L4
MAALKARVLDASGAAARNVTLTEQIFAAEIKPHLVHEAVRAELNAQRAGTFASKSRGMVSGGRAKPWRQKGTGRARAGTIRAAQFTGGGHAFAKVPRSFVLKVNRKAARAAFRSALAAHGEAGSFALLDTSEFTEPSTKRASALIAAAGLSTPLVVVLTEEESVAAKSFRNLERVAVIGPSELEVGAVVWAASLLVSETALPLVEERVR